MNLAVIPARGGSKRLYRKNIRLFAGHPLIAYSIVAARNANLVDHVIVSSEDDEILEIAASYGAKIVKRPDELATDIVKTGAVIKHAVEHVLTEHPNIEAVVTLQPTNVLRGATLIDDAVRMYLENNVDSVVTVTLNNRKSGTIVDGLFNPQYPLECRSQDMTPSFFENGLAYVTRPSFVLSGTVFGPRILPLVVDEVYASADIDTEFDFRIAEFVYKTYRDLFVQIE